MTDAKAGAKQEAREELQGRELSGGSMPVRSAKSPADAQLPSDDEVGANGGASPVRQAEEGKKRSAAAKNEPATKRRRAAVQAKAAIQKNTLDSWFGVDKRAPKKNELAEDSDEVETTPTPKRVKPKGAFTSPARSKPTNKKLVQRRILLSDQCRVCESAKTENSTRCERKCMDCEMTVHMSCYGVDAGEEVLPEKWRCRPCLATFELTTTEDVPEAEEDGDSSEEKEVTQRGIPTHEPRCESDRFRGLYRNSEYASVFLFLKRFRRLGLKLGVEVTINTLASALLAPRDQTLLYELHTKLLQNIGATISKNHNWVENLIKFLKSSDYTTGNELVRRLAACGNANDWLSTYYDVPVADRVALLKVLCEAQFDRNDALVEKIGHDATTPDSLRDEPLGADAMKRTYFLLEDPTTFPEAAAWLCRCHSLDGSEWETVADDLPSLQSFVKALSYSRETADLQLWHALSDGVLKSMERREKKKQQQDQRLARMPRLLGATGLDVASILPENGESRGRSLRTRRAVNYRSYMSDEEDDDAASESESSDRDDTDDSVEEDEDDVDGARASRQRRHARVQQGTRSSRRLRRASSPQPSESPSLRRSSRHREERNHDATDASPDNEESDDDSEA